MPNLISKIRRFKYFSPYFPPCEYDGDGLEELDILSNVSPIDMIKRFQTDKNDYLDDYENDISIWIR